MRCPECFTDWEDKDEYRIHLMAHGLDTWIIAQLTRIVPGGTHSADEPCNCTIYGFKFYCEMLKVG